MLTYRVYVTPLHTSTKVTCGAYQRRVCFGERQLICHTPGNDSHANVLRISVAAAVHARNHALLGITQQLIAPYAHACLQGEPEVNVKPGKR